MAEKNYGLIREGTGRPILKEIQIPTPRDDEVLVRTVAIALNPTDWTTLEAPGDNGTLVGCDYAGVVESVGKDVKRFKEGDRIAGFSHGGNDARLETGAFARWILVKGDLQFHVPQDVSFETGSTVGVALATSALALYETLGLPMPGEAAGTDSSPVLIYGGSTNTGITAIQLAKLSGAKVITTTSAKNFEMVKSLGADQVFDYREAGIGQKLREATNGSISLVLDCVSLEETAKICAEAIGAQGGKYISLLGPNCPRSDVESIFFLAYSVSGEAYIFEDEHWPVVPEYRLRQENFAPIADQLWAEGKYKPNRQRLEKGGLLGAIEGMHILKEGKYSGEKLVYRVDDTDWPTS